VALRAVVVGGGIGGTAAAVALARAGIDVRVYEQARQLAEVGAGVSLAPNGLRMLERLGVGDGIERLGARHASTQLRLSNGQPARHQPHEFAQAGRNTGIHRADLLARPRCWPRARVRPAFPWRWARTRSCGGTGRRASSSARAATAPVTTAPAAS
jgi:2-polyprenyl-6-methoxyphenol hydroxylase-like FAD-dependent oxidoreductase